MKAALPWGKYYPLKTVALIVTLFLFWAVPSFAERSGLREETVSAFTPLAPVLKKAGMTRKDSIAQVRGAHTHISSNGNFRLLWGDAYDPADDDWADPDGDGVPEWVETLGEALEDATEKLAGFGFKKPFGMDKYRLDVYIGNTGIETFDPARDDWLKILISQYHYAKTKVYNTHEAAYFIFNEDFSELTTDNDEQSVLRATAAHELFHAVQRNDYPWDDEAKVSNARWQSEKWWFEATATWMEELCHPDVNDYVDYVQDFLSRPEAPMSYANGFREYGASIFAGYLWRYHGEGELWGKIFENAYDAGVVEALEISLSETAGLTLKTALASFWTLSAHPADGWDDGDLYYSHNSPEIFGVYTELPSEFSTILNEAPGRFGANLIRLVGQTGHASVTFGVNGTFTGWIIGFSTDGTSGTRAARPGEAIGLNEYGDTFIAIVNVSDSDQVKTYEAKIDSAAPPVSNEDDGGGSTCFIGAMFP